MRLKQAAGGLTGSEALRREGKDEERRADAERELAEGASGPRASRRGSSRSRRRSSASRAKDPRTRPARATTRIEPTRLEASAGSAPARALSFSGAAAAVLP